MQGRRGLADECIAKPGQVYDGQASMAGVQREDTDAVLLPLFHTYLAAHITVTIDMQGHFLDARVLDVKKDEVYTIVPSTVIHRAGPARNRRLIR